MRTFPAPRRGEGESIQSNFQSKANKRANSSWADPAFQTNCEHANSNSSDALQFSGFFHLKPAVLRAQKFPGHSSKGLNKHSHRLA